MASARRTTPQGSGYKVDLVGVAATTGGAIFSELNPEGVALVIKRASLAHKVASTGAANLSAGFGTALASDTDIFNALAIGSVAANTANHGPTDPDAAAAEVIWGAAEYLNVTGSATTVGYSGVLTIEYDRID